MADPAGQTAVRPLDRVKLGEPKKSFRGTFRNYYCMREKNVYTNFDSAMGDLDPGLDDRAAY